MSQVENELDNIHYLVHDLFVALCTFKYRMHLVNKTKPYLQFHFTKRLFFFPEKVIQHPAIVG